MDGALVTLLSFSLLFSFYPPLHLFALVLGSRSPFALFHPLLLPLLRIYSFKKAPCKGRTVIWGSSFCLVTEKKKGNQKKKERKGGL